MLVDVGAPRKGEKEKVMRLAWNAIAMHGAFEGGAGVASGKQVKILIKKALKHFTKRCA